MANFAILRVAKMNNFGSLSASGQHNFRERITKNADAERTPLNEIDGAKNTRDLVKAVSDLLPVKRRKDAVICIEYMISASPEHFGVDWREAENHGADYFKDAIEWLEKRHGKGNVVCTTVHLDESTPHLAAYVVPRTVDGRLSAKDFVGGRTVLSKMQTDFAGSVGVKHGLVRGLERSNSVHQENAKIAPMTAERLALRKRVKALESEIDRLVKSAGAGGAALAAAQKALEQSQGDLVMATERNEYLQIRTEKVRLALVNLTEEKKAMEMKLKTATERDHELVAEITALRAENKDAQASLEQLRAINRVIVDQARDRLDKEAQEAAKAAQEAFSEKWVGVREADAIERKHLPVADVCGNRVVYSLGKGNYAIHTFAPGEIVPKMRSHTEQKRNGIER